MEQGAAWLAEAVGWVVKTNGPSPDLVAAAAVPFLHLAGTVVGGWLIGRQAEAALAGVGQPGADAAFLNGKIAVARHYVDHVLPHAAADRQAATAGAQGVAAFDQTWL